MNRAGLFAFLGILGLVVLMAAGFPLSYVKASHCHPTHSQTPPVVQPPAPAAAPSAERPRAARRVAMPTPSPQNAHSQSGPSNAAAAPASLEEIYSRDLPLAIQSIGRAVSAIESGDRQTELAELTKAVAMLASIHQSLGRHVKVRLANSRCPIMGSAVNPDSVPATLTRDYNGRKVGFCCAGCPSAWDKLTDAQKQAKLSALKS